MKLLTIDSNDAKQRLDKFLLKTFPHLPKSALYKALRTKNIKYNAKRCYGNERLTQGDVLQVYLPDDLLIQKQLKFYCSEKTIDIIYEDNNILVANKPAGLKSQPDVASEDSLIGRILSYLIRQKSYLPEHEQSFAPALCNRLDRNTNGLVIAAKNAAALRSVNQMFSKNLITKIYHCHVHGSMPKQHDVLLGWWTKNGRQNLVIITKEQRPQSKKVITEYDVISKNNNSSLLKIILHTGRSHQIRAHLSSIGHPLIGDKKYGSQSKLPYRLTAYTLVFNCNRQDDYLGYLQGKTISLL